MQTTKTLSYVAETLLKKLGLPQSHLFTATASEGLGKLTLSITQSKLKKALILTDVIASGATIKRLSGCLEAVNCEYQTIAFVKNENIKNIHYSFVTATFGIHQKRPEHWLQKNIHEVNTENNALITNNKTTKTLPKLDVFEKWADAMGAIYVGHINYESMCYLTFFDTLKIIRHSDIYFVSKVVKQIEKIVSRSLSANAEILLLHASSNDEAKQICLHIHERVNNVAIKIKSFYRNKMPENELNLTASLEHVVFFVDTAMTTATTFKHALEWAAVNSCNEFHSYIFIDRTKGTESDLIEGIERYKGMSVEHTPIYRVHTPSFETYCPMCSLNQKLESFNEFVQSGKLNKAITRWKAYLKQFTLNNSCDTKLEDKKVSGKSIYVRHLVELCAIQKNDIATLEYTKNIITEIKNSKDDLSSLIEVFWYESFTFANNRLDTPPTYNFYIHLTNEIKDCIYSAVIEAIFSSSTAFDMREKALWLAAALNYPELLSQRHKLCEILSTSQQMCSTFAVICCWLTKPEMIPELERLFSDILYHTDQQDVENYLYIRDVFEEANSYLSLKKAKPQKVRSFIQSLSKLRELFEQEDRTHTESCHLFTQRVHTSNSAKNLLDTVKLQQRMEDIFKDMFDHLEIVLTALKLKDSKYDYLIKRQYEGDFNKIKMELNKLTSMAKAGKISNSEIMELQASYLDECSERFSSHFIDKEDSLIWELIEQCKSNLTETINNQKNRLAEVYSNKGIRFNFERCSTGDMLTSIPKKHLEDILHTIIDNSYKYSNQNSTILVHTKRTQDYLVFTLESFSTDHQIKLVNGHGLANTNKILTGFNSKINISNDSNNQILTFELPYLEVSQ